MLNIYNPPCGLLSDCVGIAGACCYVCFACVSVFIMACVIGPPVTYHGLSSRSGDFIDKIAFTLVMSANSVILDMIMLCYIPSQGNVSS